MRTWNPLRDLYELIDRSIVDEPPITVREGNIIKDGYSEEADKYRKAKTEGKAWLADLETEEKEKTGIKKSEDQVQQGVRLLF